MGYYINPKGETKEAFLAREGVEIDKTDAALTLDAVPVCLVDNDEFTAACIAYSDQELLKFCNPDDYRPKRFFAVPRSVLKEYCTFI